MEANSLFGWETIIMGRAARPKRHRRSWDGSSLELVESKLHPPPARPGIVARTGLVERLLASDAVPVGCVVAPAGYGKTTLLAQWAQHTVHRVGWVSLDQRDNDPAVLLTYIGAALDRVEPIDPRIVQALAGPGAPIVGVVRRLAAAMAVMPQPVALVLDHLELLETQHLELLLGAGHGVVGGRPGGVPTHPGVLHVVIDAISVGVSVGGLVVEAVVAPQLLLFGLGQVLVGVDPGGVFDQLLVVGDLDLVAGGAGLGQRHEAGLGAEQAGVDQGPLRLAGL